MNFFPWRSILRLQKSNMIAAVIQLAHNALKRRDYGRKALTIFVIPKANIPPQKPIYTSDKAANQLMLHPAKTAQLQKMRRTVLATQKINVCQPRNHKTTAENQRFNTIFPVQSLIDGVHSFGVSNTRQHQQQFTLIQPKHCFNDDDNVCVEDIRR